MEQNQDQSASKDSTTRPLSSAAATIGDPSTHGRSDSKRKVHRANPISTAAQEYYEELRDELRSIGADDVPKCDAVDWSAVYQLERRLLEAAKLDRLSRRAWILRNRFREVAGEPKYALYIASNPPAFDKAASAVDDAEAIALRADLMELHHQIVRESIFANAMEQQRAMLSRRMAWITFGILACLFLLLISPSLEPWAQYSIIGALIVTLFAWIGWGGSVMWRRSKMAIVLCVALGAGRMYAQPASAASVNTGTGVTEPASQNDHSAPLQPLTTLAMAAIAGFLGGTLSVVRRLQTPAVDGDAIRNLQKLVAAESYIVLAPISGVIAALVLYSFFSGGLLEGSLFPTITCELHVASTTSFLDFLTRSGPKSCADQGKVIVWCFIAGFAERLVPDAIDRMTQASTKE